MAKPTLNVFYHLQKTAGSSVIKHIQKNVPADEQLEVSARNIGMLEQPFDHAEITAAVNRYFDSMTQAEKNKIRFIYGHYLVADAIEYFDPQRKTFEFTFVRDPLKRSISTYNYYRGWYEFEANLRDRRWLYDWILLDNGTLPNFKTWFEKKLVPTRDWLGLAQLHQYYHWLGHLGKPSQKYSHKKLEKFFSKLDYIGTTETFEQDTAYLYYLWSFDKFFIRDNPSRKFFKQKKSPHMAAAVKKKLKTAYQAYDLAVAQREKIISQIPNFDTKVFQALRLKKRRLMWTQLRYDWPDNLHVRNLWQRLSW